VSDAALPLRPPAPGSVSLLGSGPYTRAFSRNQQQYLKAWFGIDAAAGGDAADPTEGIDNLAYYFRQRAGNATPAGRPVGWDCGLRGSAAGGVLGGAGHSLRWSDDASLRAAVKGLVDAIADSADEATGYAAAFAPNETVCHENPDYVTSWLAHGLLAADEAGVPRALLTLRRHLSWFDNSTWLPMFLPTDSGPGRDLLPPKFSPTFGGVGAPCGHLVYLEYQGMIHSTRMALSSMGTQADVDLVRELYEERWWLQELAARNLTAVWHRVPFAHNYEGTAMNAFLDMHRLTGDALYLDAALQWWSMMREAWIDPASGVITLNEMILYPPRSYLLTFNGYDSTYPSHNPFPPEASDRGVMRAAAAPGASAGEVAGGVLLPEPHAASEPQATGPIAPVCKGPEAEPHAHTAALAAYTGAPIGELCGHVFWVLLNARMRRLYPQNATFADEIERTMVNVALAQSVGLGPDGRTRGIRHFASLHRAKMPPRRVQDCCEGSGTRLFGNLPEFVFMVNDGGAGPGGASWHRGQQLGNTTGLGRVVVDQLFAATVEVPGAEGAGWRLNVTVLESGFPLSGRVTIAVHVVGAGAPAVGPGVSVRVPAWAGGAAAPAGIVPPNSSVTVPFDIDGRTAADARPGTFAALSAPWSRDPARPTLITADMPMLLTAQPYEGTTAIEGHRRVAVRVGPVVLAATGAWSNATGSVLITGVTDPAGSDPSSWLEPLGGMRYGVRQDPAVTFVPYFSLEDDVLMDVYPAFRAA